MPVERVPGLMDYLLPALQQYAEIDQQNKSRDLQAKHMQAQEAQSNAGLMTQLFNVGAVDANQLEGSLAQAGINTNSIKVQPNKAQRRRQVLEQGDQAINQLSDDQKEELGFKTTTQRSIDTAQRSEADLSTKKNDIFSRYLGGDQLTPQERAATGLLGADDIEMKRVSQLDPYLGQLGERYVAGEMVKNGGRIDPRTAKQTAEQAYANYVTERGQNGLGALTPEQVAYTRQYFARATENALIAQHKMDIEDYTAKSGRIHAEAARNQAGQNTNIKWFAQINSAKENIRKAQQDLMKSNPALGPALDNPALAQSPMVKGAMQRYLELEQTAEAFRGAQGALAEGQVPGNLAALLQAAEGITSQGTAASGAQGPGAAGARGAAPQAGAAPAPSGSPDPIGAAVDLLISGKGTPQQLQQLVTAGRITQQQYSQIMQQYQAKASTKKK